MKRYKGTNWVVIGTRLCVIRCVYVRNWDHEVTKVIAEVQYLRQGLKNSENFAKLISRTKDDEINVISVHQKETLSCSDIDNPKLNWTWLNLKLIKKKFGVLL